MGKIKKFVKDHKVEIVVGTVTAVATAAVIVYVGNGQRIKNVNFGLYFEDDDPTPMSLYTLTKANGTDQLFVSPKWSLEQVQSLNDITKDIIKTMKTAALETGKDEAA